MIGKRLGGALLAAALFQACATTKPPSLRVQARSTSARSASPA